MQEAPQVTMQRMSDREYAAYSQILGYKEIKVGGIYWNQIRPFFFRPLLPFLEYSPQTIYPPWTSIVGGFQYAVSDGVVANSCLNYRMFEKAGAYSIYSLDHNRRRQVRRASDRFTIRPMDDVNEFTTKAYQVYLSFDERTHYKTGAWRRLASGFARWADALFQLPKIVVLGGFQNNELRGVSVSMCVEDTVVYASSFCDTESLRWHLPDLMLHSVREMAATLPDVVQIYGGMCIGERGLDHFYALRGCTLVNKPAVLRLNPLTQGVLKYCRPQLYAKLRGR
jgi:hypothetical protein